MKRAYITLSILFLAAACAFSQHNNLQVIASAGEVFESSSANLSLSWTLGEVVASTGINESADIILTQGFQQGQVVAAETETESTQVPIAGLPNYSAKLFPNPASSEVNLTILNADPGKFIVKVMDITGRKVISEELIINTSEHTLSLSINSLKGGIYLVGISSESGNKLVLRLIKN